MLGGNTVCLDQGKKGERESWGGGQETSFTGKQDQEAQPKPNAEYDLVCVCVCMCMSRERGCHPSDVNVKPLNVWNTVKNQ